MSSQPRARKASHAREPGPQTRPSGMKASGDSAACNAKPKVYAQGGERSGSKNKIPKNLRYDLENALVGLCDVWFEEIKPHLIRNNIKLHVDGMGAGPAGGDHHTLPSGAPGCSHLDPGAASDHIRRQSVNFAAYSSTQPTASRAPCAKPRVSLPPPAPPRAQRASPERTQYKSVVSQSQRPTLRPQNQAPPPNKRDQEKYRVPRLCRTLSTQAPTAPRCNNRNIHTAPHASPKPQKQRKPRKPAMIDKSIQTSGCTIPQISGNKDNVHTRPQRFDKKVQQGSTLTTCGSCHGKTNLSIPPRPGLPRVKECHKSSSPNKSLFDKDLIEKISTAYENHKELKVLFRNPRNDDFPSIMNLLPCTGTLQKDAGRRGAGRMPWR